MVYHCFFEQSGTFKNEFKKLGYEAYDYDILNDFNETNYVVDLFNEIKKAYINEPSIFDNFKENQDFIIAFFPCIRFEEQILLYFRGEASTQKKWSLEQKLEYDLKLHEELHELYNLITKLTIVCNKKKIPLIIENPYGSQHYLTRYWCVKSSFIDKNRFLNGDYYEKPTQYWFINCEPKENFVFEPLEYVEKKIVNHAKRSGNLSHQKMRSMIHPQYANRFIKQFILEEKEYEKLRNN